MIEELGEGYVVRLLQESDINGPYAAWFEDQEATRFNRHGKLFPSRRDLQEFLAQANSATRIDWAICDGSGRHIGNVSLSNLAFIDKSAEFAILIGDGAHRGKGVGFRAARALLLHGFLKVNLERISCGTVATNEGMIALARALGMQAEGRRRSAAFLEGNRVDVLEFGVLRDEFLQHVLH